MVVLRAEALAARLRDLGIATPQQLEQAKQELASTQERFSAILVRLGILRDVEAGRRLATQLGSMPQPLGVVKTALPTIQEIPSAVWRSHRLVPMREEEGKLLLATDDPLSVFALEFFGRRCGRMMEVVLIREQDLAPLLTTLETSGVPVSRAPAAPPATAELREPAAPQRAAAVAAPLTSAATGRMPEKPADAAGDEPIIQLVDSMLSEAVRMRASDVHIEPGQQQIRVRYRIDGVLHDVNSPPKALQGPIVSRVKIMGGLNIAEKRLPQDGRLQLTVEGRPLDVRVSTLPAMHGESIVMRLLDRSQPIRGLAEMGMLEVDRTVWDGLIRRPHGMVLVTGPTGSGKTTTLYGALTVLNQPDRKLITVEDPVEYQVVGVNQVAVKSGIGLTFAAGLRSMLRQAPDVIMVGEIRDQETAQVAIQAALTGHLVLSTLHTNDAPSAITRLIDMGIAPFLAASTVQGVLAQRLVRRICPECRITDNATEEERAFLGPPEMTQVIRSNGCDKCHGSGFFGRVGIFELLVISDALRKLIVAKASASAIRAQAVKEGMRGLRDDGCAKIREGLTTLSEVLRVIAGE
ncbi:MAG: Flp pilus assembly complex ATPase component TadA [Candidatus Omnitrophica bacterium]|nr:Flp pilus assembly complex ATPase component TadA [Candidatus Omnitrophota bacterium]